MLSPWGVILPVHSKVSTYFSWTQNNAHSAIALVAYWGVSTNFLLLYFCLRLHIMGWRQVMAQKRFIKLASVCASLRMSSRCQAKIACMWEWKQTKNSKHILALSCAKQLLYQTSHAKTERTARSTIVFCFVTYRAV